MSSCSYNMKSINLIALLFIVPSVVGSSQGFLRDLFDTYIGKPIVNIDWEYGELACAQWCCNMDSVIKVFGHLDKRCICADRDGGENITFVEKPFHSIQGALEWRNESCPELYYIKSLKNMTAKFNWDDGRNLCAQLCCNLPGDSVISLWIWVNKGCNCRNRKPSGGLTYHAFPAFDILRTPEAGNKPCPEVN